MLCDNDVSSSGTRSGVNVCSLTHTPVLRISVSSRIDGLDCFIDSFIDCLIDSFTNRFPGSLIDTSGTFFFNGNWPSSSPSWVYGGLRRKSLKNTLDNMPEIKRYNIGQHNTWKA